MSSTSSARVPASRVLLVASFGAFLAFLDATIVNVAFPSIRESFAEADIGALSWVLNAYNIVFAAFLILFGRLTDLLGRRRSFVTGVAVFTIASVLCGLAPSVEFLIGARVLQALGAAMLVPASLALVIAAFPSDRRAHAVGIWGASAAIAAGLGPPIGGVLVQLWDWRAAFLVNLPFGLVAVWAARHELVESRAPGRRMVPDLVGAALLVLALGALNLGIIRSEDWGWTGPETIACFAAAIVLTGLFVISSRRHRAPMLDPLLLRLHSFNVGSVATIVAGLGFYAYLLTNVLWLQYVWGYSVIVTGLALVPGPLVAAVVASRLGPLAERYGYRPFVVPGALIWAAAFLWYHQMVGPEPAFWAEWLPGQILSGLGVGATLPLLGSASLAAVPGGRYATASAVVSAARQVGGVLGIAVIVVLIGELAPATVIDSLRDGWLLSVAAFLLVALLALPLGRIEAIDEDDTTEERPAVIHRPAAPADWAVPAAAGSEADHAATDLSALPMFAALPDRARTRLEQAARLTHVPAGAYLMQEGDPPGSAYIVRTGRLEVTLGDTVVRELGAGQVLGELALLSGEPRSATVRARRDTTLTEIPREAFDEVLESDPAAARYVLTQVADRLRTAGGPPGPPPPERVSVIAVVGLGPSVSTDEVQSVGDALERRLDHHVRLLAVRRPGALSADGLARAELDYDRVLLVAGAGHRGADADGPDDVAWREFCVREADSVVLVARSDDAVPTGPPAPVPSRRPELVLLGAAPEPDVRAGWVAATDAWQLTVVDGDPAGSTGLRALADRLAGRSLGLVLAGGGARAFTHVGILRELEDSGIHVDRVAGASVGGIIAAAHALGVDGETLEEICYAEFVRRRPFSDYRLPSQSIARGHRVKAAMERTYGRDNVIEGLPRQLSVVSVDLVSRTRQVHRRGRVVDAALASSRLPVLFAPLPTDDGRLLLDGGVLDNMPTDLLVERDEGPVVAVSIGSGGEGKPRSGRPKVPALGDTLMRTMMIGSAGAVESARSRGAWVVVPSSMGVGLLEFHQFDRMVQSGRAAVRQLLAEANGDLFAAPPPVDGDRETRRINGTAEDAAGGVPDQRHDVDATHR
ncbi:DHA2 family efflux MFS transporter permease subunit [Nostocoides sp. F2B08]|uniref:MFS transporter n=1 Tax=Nostocoides sp. F2B08 TaxID=2653936 RepID=UPI001263BE31|nr:DHA2 family efflux MFS transporter permease subunit [Tetrasphaera sp. F2B08]KAB7745607.1 DHA2 family efflux MFS transporter permease subunit [Tetrasphaera sp. F2B08]